MIWYKLRSWYDIQVCEYLSTPEKVWKKVRSGACCFGLCQVYLRTNKGRDHQYFRDNTLLLESLRDDSAWLHSKGYGVILAGDFNAHTGNEPVLGFRSHSHACNKNGELLIWFCQSLHLSCLNTIVWGGSARESPTLQRFW